MWISSTENISSEIRSTRQWLPWKYNMNKYFLKDINIIIWFSSSRFKKKEKKQRTRRYTRRTAEIHVWKKRETKRRRSALILWQQLIIHCTNHFVSLLNKKKKLNQQGTISTWIPIKSYWTDIQKSLFWIKNNNLAVQSKWIK